MSSNRDHRQIPAAATRFSGSPFRFAESDQAADGVPVTLRLRGLEEINHWWWGRIVHDMDGLTIHKDRLPIDYCHDPEQILGYLDTFATKDGLEVSGKIFPGEDPRADEVYRKAAKGIPYESSMDWADPDTELEWLPEGVTTAVNGRQFAGPGYVVRKWSLRGAAICPYGADKHATTNFAAGDTVGITIVSQGDLPDMAKQFEKRRLKTIAPQKDVESEKVDETEETTTETTTETTVAVVVESSTETTTAEPAETPTETEEPVVPTPDPEEEEETAQDTARKAAGKRFRDAYGEQFGAQYFADGLSFEAAGKRYAKHLRDENARLTDAAKEQAKQIKALRDRLGEREPVSMTPENSATTKTGKLQDKNLARFTGGIKLPSAN